MWDILKKAALLWYDRDGDRLAAVVSYYAIFALVPLLLTIITLVGVLFGENFVREILAQWVRLLGPELIGLLASAIDNLKLLSNDFRIPLIGVVFFTGMGIIGFNEFTNGLHALWGVPHEGVRGFLKKSMYSITFILFLNVFIAVSIAITSFLFLIATTISIGILGIFLFTLLRIGISIILLTVLFTFAFRILSIKSPNLKSLSIGALVASILFTISTFLTTLYVHITPVPDLYGTAGLLIALLIWVFVSTSILYFGAAVAYVHARGELI